MRFLKIHGVFYGWWIVAASLVIATYVNGVVMFGFTAIFEPIADELGWSYAQVSIAASVRVAVLGSFALVAGVFADRFGPRRIIAAGACCIAAGLFTLSHTHSLATFYGAYVLSSIGASFCTYVVLMAAVSNWFERRAGLASGIVLSGLGGFGALLIPLIVQMIETYDWRLSVSYLAAGTLVVVLPLSLVLRHRPEHYNMLPDGKRRQYPVGDDVPGCVNRPKTEIGARRALRSRAFWHMALSGICLVTVVMSVMTHIMPYLTSVGLNRSLSGIVASAIPVISILGRISFGWLGDRYGSKTFAAMAFGMMSAGGILLALNTDVSLWVLVVFTLVFGTGFGAIVVLRVSLIRELFGPTRFGAILGTMEAIGMLGGLAGPPLAGWVFDEYGSYQCMWYAVAGLMLVGLALMKTMPSGKTDDVSGSGNNKREQGCGTEQ